MDKLLEIEQLTKVFSLGSITSRIRITAVHNISFFLKPAEIFTLAGESGCGKTTTAKMILGFEEPTSGIIRYNGQNKATERKGLVYGRGTGNFPGSL
jgi:peptide/nickel transport system ATP-binding protein